MNRQEEEELLRGVRAENEARARREEREAYRDKAIAHLTMEQQVTNTKIDNMNVLWNERFSGISARVAAVEADVEDTGKHIVDDNAMKQAQRIAQLQEEKALLESQRRDSGTWLRRQATQWGAGAAGGLTLILIGALVAHFFGGH